LRAARELRSDLIVVGTHGRTGLSHFWLGSVAETLVRLAPVPVLTLRSESPEAEPTREERQAEDELSG
jgi:nucleotide-binding universal stress UspA family protein